MIMFMLEIIDDVNQTGASTKVYWICPRPMCLHMNTPTMPKRLKWYQIHHVYARVKKKATDMHVYVPLTLHIGAIS
jgi:hypothetical protein